MAQANEFSELVAEQSAMVVKGFFQSMDLGDIEEMAGEVTALEKVNVQIRDNNRACKTVDDDHTIPLGFFQQMMDIYKKTPVEKQTAFANAARVLCRAYLETLGFKMLSESVELLGSSEISPHMLEDSKNLATTALVKWRGQDYRDTLTVSDVPRMLLDRSKDA